METKRTEVADDERAALLDRLQKAKEAAWQEVERLTSSAMRGTWSIPANPARDTDLIFAEVLQSAESAQALLEADGKRIALAEKAIADAIAAANDAGMVNWEENNYAAGAHMVAFVLATYDAAKGATHE